jgi:hypothetical protein
MNPCRQSFVLGAMIADEQRIKTRILEAIRRFNGELDWTGLAVAAGINPYAAEAPVALLAADLTSLQHADAFRLEFDEHGIARFWLDSGADR